MLNKVNQNYSVVLYCHVYSVSQDNKRCVIAFLNIKYHTFKKSTLGHCFNPAIHWVERENLSNKTIAIGREVKGFLTFIYIIGS